MTNSYIKTFSENYKRLKKLIPNIEQMQVGEHLKIENKPFMDLHIDILERDDKTMVLAMAHNGLQNGDVMADPDIELKLYFDEGFGGMLEALSYQNDYMGVYHRVYNTIDGVKMVNKARLKSINSFLRQWLINLKNQGFTK